MKKVLASLVILGMLAGSAFGCSYGSIAVAGDKVVVMRQDMFLFGALRKAYVCKIADGGLTSCSTNESP